MLGWRDRTFAVAGAAAGLFSRGGGMIPATVVADGRVVGRWRRDRSGGVTPDLFEPVDEQALAVESEDVARFAR